MPSSSCRMKAEPSACAGEGTAQLKPFWGSADCVALTDVLIGFAALRMRDALVYSL